MTLKPILILTAAVAGLSSAAPTLADTLFLPGLWETRTRSVGDNDVETNRDCVTPEETRRETLERRLAEMVKDPSCKYTQRSIGGGKFAIAGTCNNGGMKSTVRQTGTFSPTTLNMTMAMTLVAAPGAKPVTMNIVSSSRRLAPTCPAGSDDE